MSNTPNHCNNHIEVVGPKADLDRFLEAAKLVEENDVTHISLEKLFPTPPDLEEGLPERVILAWRATKTGAPQTERGVLKTVYEPDSWKTTLYAPGVCPATTFEEWVAWENERNGRPIEELAKIYDERIEKYGFQDWYPWRVNHWGTKWDLYDWDEPERTDGPDKSKWSANFLSAWSPPTEAFTKIAADWPTLSFRIKYSEEGCGFEGYAIWKNGELEAEVTRDITDFGDGDEDFEVEA